MTKPNCHKLKFLFLLSIAIIHLLWTSVVKIDVK